MTAPRLDFLLYAHDGRGLGHASRAITIGMALRRLAPGSRVLLVSGSAHAQALIDFCRLDWLKLPSYETIIIDGTSRGVEGPSGFTDLELAELRRMQLFSVINNYRPKVVLVDHQPQGKHKELLDALDAGRAFDTKWVLGVRGVVGEVPQLASEQAVKTFSKFYSGLIWFGDANVLGREYPEKLGQFLGRSAFESGYVCRLAEIRRCREILTRNLDGQLEVAATVAIPWFDRGSESFLAKLAAVLPNLHLSGQWHLYLDTSKVTKGMKEIVSALNRMECCRVMRPGASYVDSLLSSKCAVIYGGYNSLTDVIGCGLPALVLLREMADREQQLHLKSLLASTDGVVPVSPEEISVEQLSLLLQQLPAQKPRKPARINLDGAEKAARYLLDFLS